MHYGKKGVLFSEASSLWNDLKSVEDWLLNKERESQRTDLGHSDSEAEQLYNDVEVLYQESKVK